MKEMEKLKNVEFKKMDLDKVYKCITPSICYVEAVINDIHENEYKVMVHSSFPNSLFISKDVQHTPILINNSKNNFYEENIQTAKNNHWKVFSTLYGVIFEELCKSDLNHKFKFAFTEAGLHNAKLFICECKAKQKEVLDAQLDTVEDTFLPTEESILCDLNDNFYSEDGFYVNAWGVTDSSNYDLPLGMEIGRDFVILMEYMQEKMHDMVYKPCEIKDDVNKNINYKMLKKNNEKKTLKDKLDGKEKSGI